MIILYVVDVIRDAPPHGQTGYVSLLEPKIRTEPLLKPHGNNLF